MGRFLQYSKKLNELQIMLSFLDCIDSNEGYTPHLSADSGLQTQPF